MMEYLEKQPLTEQVIIRVLRGEDLPALEWGGEYRHFRRLYADIYRSACQGKALMWVAELPEVGIIGQVFVQLSSGRRELADGVRRAYIYGFRIQPAYRGVGIGGRMLQIVEEDLLQRRFLFVTLNVARENIAALRFYQQHGYQVVAEEAGEWSYLDDTGRRREVHEPAWRMEKALTQRQS
ncbi:MAG: GNAT family N-acetyltransferase [Anaerolineales bacterium]|nr:GNAT family N-acetyltransferase [Anaerolineales bacterium]